MSGGSFNYIYIRDLPEVFAQSYQIKKLAQTLAEEFPDSAAARDTQRFYDTLQRMEADYNGDDLMSMLREVVWHAVEWWVSDDYNREQMSTAVAQYELEYELECRKERDQ